MNELAINALRMNPDRLIVGEVRGQEALTLLLACTQGNDGALCTVHADSSEGVFGRLQMYLAMTRERGGPGGRVHQQPRPAPRPRPGRVHRRDSGVGSARSGGRWRRRGANREERDPQEPNLSP